MLFREKDDTAVLSSIMQVMKKNDEAAQEEQKRIQQYREHLYKDMAPVQQELAEGEQHDAAKKLANREYRVSKKMGQLAKSTGKTGVDTGSKTAKSFSQQAAKDITRSSKTEEVEEVVVDAMINEVLSKDADAGKWINDFVHSDNPKFKGKSKEKRKQMALAAYYAKQEEGVELPVWDSLSEAQLDEISLKKITWAIGARERQMTKTLRDPNKTSEEKWKSELHGHKQLTRSFAHSQDKHIAMRQAQAAQRKAAKAATQTEEVEQVAEADKLNARIGINIAHKVPRAGQTNLRNIPAMNHPGSVHAAAAEKDRAARPEKLKAAIKSSLGKHTKPNLPEEVDGEAGEQLDELKKSTLGSYIKKATKSVQATSKIGTDFDRDATKQIGDSFHATQTGDATRAELKRREYHISKAEADAFNKATKQRIGNISKAVDRLTKEEVEQVDELNKGTLQSYAKKADASADEHSKKSIEAWEKGDNATSDKHFSKMGNRAFNVGKALAKAKVAKEETAPEGEQLDELKKSTLQSYWKKSDASMNKRGTDAKGRTQFDRIKQRIKGRGDVAARLKGEKPMSEEADFITHLQTALVAEGQYEVPFTDGSSQLVDSAVAQTVLLALEQLTSDDRLKIESHIQQSHKNLMDVHKMVS